jgi:hypothetical protein
MDGTASAILLMALQSGLVASGDLAPQDIPQP